MSEKEILRKQLTHVLLRMNLAVNIMCVGVIILGVSYIILGCASLWWLMSIPIALLFAFLVFLRSWQTPARVLYLVSILPKEVDHHVGANFETVCLNGNMRYYTNGVMDFENKRSEHINDFWKDWEHESQSYWLGVYLRSITKWA